MNKQRLKRKLALRKLNEVYCRLQPSTIHGVGVFAIKKIPSGTNPFKNSFMAQEAVLIFKDEIPNEYKEMLKDYHPSDPETKQQIVSNYPNQPIWTNYINYSEQPNIQLMENGEWVVLRDIETGEELLENPKNLLNEDGTYKSFKIKIGQYPTLS